MRIAPLLLVVLFALLVVFRSPAIAQSPASSELQARADALIGDVLRSALGPGSNREVRGELTQLVDSTHFRVRSDMQTVPVTLSPAALPQIRGFEFGLITSAEAIAEARRTNQRVWFVQVDIEQIDDTRARVRIGPDYALPPESIELKTCCCVQQVTYRRDGLRWVYEGRSGSCG